MFIDGQPSENPSFVREELVAPDEGKSLNDIELYKHLAPKGAFSFPCSDDSPRLRSPIMVNRLQPGPQHLENP